MDDQPTSHNSAAWLPSMAANDLHLFYALVQRAGEGQPFTALLDAVRTYFDAPALAFRPAHDPLATGDAAWVLPIEYNGHSFGHLYLPRTPTPDVQVAAERIAVVIPALALALAAGQSPTGRDGHRLVTIEDEYAPYEALLDASNEAILMLDTEGRVVVATAQFETFTGIPRGTLIGDPVEKLIAAIEHRPNLPAALAHTLRTLAATSTDSAAGEIEVTEPQLRILVWYSPPVYSRAGRLLGRMIALRDATHEREIDLARVEFITLISHELRTPLTAIKGFSDLMMEGNLATLPDPLQEYMSIISINADRLTDLLNDILDITRIETNRVQLDPSACDMTAVIRQVAVSMQPLLDKHQHRLVLTLEEGLPSVWADRSRMEQIVSNLVNNAIKYTANPGEITISAQEVTQNADLPKGAPDDLLLPSVMVAVKDTGLGIAPEDRPHLFKRFYRANTSISRIVGGTGLGLMIVRSLVEMHGGQVWFDSTEGHGSTFYFTVPLASNPSPTETSL